MTIEQLWQEMEAEGEANVAWLTRYARPQSCPQLLVALEQSTRARALLVPVNKSALPPRREWPVCQGLELISVGLDSQPHFGVRLSDPSSADVFTALAEDVVPRVAATSGGKEAVDELLGRLRRWQQFLTATRDYLSVEAQRGLWGELHVLRTHLLPSMGAFAAVDGWKASGATHQDFQFPGGAVEIKTTAAKQPQSVRITSERQLDDTGVGTLYLYVVMVDEREVSVGIGPGRSLPVLIADIRSDLSMNPVALAVFNDRLFDRGWLEAQASRYDGRRWTVRAELTYQVREGFPRLVEDDLPAGIGEVSFALSLAACEPFAVPSSQMRESLSQLKST